MPALIHECSLSRRLLSFGCVCCHYCISTTHHRLMHVYSQHSLAGPLWGHNLTQYYLLHTQFVITDYFFLWNSSKKLETTAPPSVQKNAPYTSCSLLEVQLMNGWDLKYCILPTQPDSSWPTTWVLYNAVPLRLLQVGVSLRVLWGYCDATVTWVPHIQ